ncbi:helix-turn-helix domain-containing protein [Pseudonocardia sp. C8]|uniref:PucR family transcriptional regulator n=1 Tax=Pseudonocardia sp. C8 TaxID=2762759 RepID=UPI0016429F0B|nr:helix-turn-helix domain-containing protein [Pseudonocardia sp. C8]MBC3190339.1 helix-turn-helix domain-containing protein [Pseudonocardia sp. C8]
MVTPIPRPERSAAELIVDSVRADLPALLDTVVQRIVDEVPMYARDDVVPADDLYRSVRTNVEYIFDGLTGAAPVDARAPAATGRARAAQGAPLVEVLSAYRVGFGEVWARLVATARRLPGVPEDAVIDLAGSGFALHNAYCDAVIEAYRDEARLLLRARERERAVLVGAILTGSAEKGTVWEVAEALRLPVEGAFMVVAATAELGHDPMPRVESALAACDVTSVWRLENDLSLGVLSLADRSRSEEAMGVLDRHAGGPVGVSPVFGELRQAAWALRLARLALQNLPPDGGVEQFRDQPLSVLLAAAPHAALETAHVVLGGLLELPPDDRDLLLATFEAWVEAGGSAQAAGTILFCHPNTVRYRLRRIATVTGRDLGAPADIAELVAATRAWFQLPHRATS